MNKYLVSVPAFSGLPLPLKGKRSDGSEVLFAGLGRRDRSAVLEYALLAGAEGLFCDGSYAAGDSALKIFDGLQMENDCAFAESLCAGKRILEDKKGKTTAFRAAFRSFLAERGNGAKRRNAAGSFGALTGMKGLGYE